MKLQYQPQPPGGTVEHIKKHRGEKEKIDGFDGDEVLDGGVAERQRVGHAPPPAPRAALIGPPEK